MFPPIGFLGSALKSRKIARDLELVEATCDQMQNTLVCPRALCPANADASWA